MATMNLNELRGGMKVLMDGDPCNVVENDFYKPGKGQALFRVRLKNLMTGRMLEKNFKGGETVEVADVVERTMQYLYSDSDGWHFMDPATYEQHAAKEAAVGDAINWIKEQDDCVVTLFNGFPIAVTAPTFVNLRVTETDPGVRGDTSSGGTKPATLETGAVVKVPLFIQTDELLRIDTRTAEYVSRAKE
jgi:elongation factor P